MKNISTQVAVILITTIFLVSCKEKSDTNLQLNKNSENAVKVETVTETTIGTGGLQGYEIINGIVVPHEPDATLNNATLAGIDINNNGVRDDVERMIATTFGRQTSSFLRAATDAAKQAQISLKDSSKRANALKNYGCLMRGIQEYEVAMLRKTIFNTKERRVIFFQTPPLPDNFDLSTIDAYCADAYPDVSIAD